jgi:hypothetical protein
MIYQLMKRAPAWKYLPYLILAGAAAGSLSRVFPSDTIPVCCWLPFVGALSCSPNRRATRYEASLPVAGRQLFLARVLLILAAIWLPAVAGYCAGLISGGPAKLGPALAGCAATMTLMVMAIQSVRVRELCAPRWVVRVAVTIMVGTLAAVAVSNAGIPALMVCAPLSAALLFRTWRAIPKSFQIAPPGERCEHSPGGLIASEPSQLAAAGMATDVADSAGQPDTVWMPLLRSVFSGLYVYFLPFLFFGAATGARIGSCCICLPFPWLLARQRLGWARTLPIRPRIALWIILAPALLTLALGYFASFLGPNTPLASSPLELLLGLASTIEWALLVALFMALLDWRRLRRVSLVIRRVLLDLLLGVPIVATLAGIFLHKPIVNTLLPEAMMPLSRALPGGPVAAIAFATIELAALGWALGRVFEEGEYTDKMGSARGVAAQ